MALKPPAKSAPVFPGRKSSYSRHMMMRRSFMSLNAGARGYLLRSECAQILPHSMVTESLLASFLTRPTGRAPVLNHRQRNMVQLIAQGHTSRQIANVLNIKSKARYEDFRRYCALHKPQRAHRALSSVTVNPLLLNAMETAEGSSKVARARIATWVGVFRRTRHRASDLFPPWRYLPRSMAEGLLPPGG